MVVTSSVQALGCFIGLGRPDYLPLDDAHPARAVRAYGLSKLIAEHVRLVHETTGVPTVCLRPPWVFAPSMYEASGPRGGRTPRRSGRRSGSTARSSTCATWRRRSSPRSIAPLTGHHRLLVCAEDVSSAEMDSRALVRKLLPGVEWRGGSEYDAEPFRALIDTRRRGTLLGWLPRHRWRSRIWSV